MKKRFALKHIATFLKLHAVLNEALNMQMRFWKKVVKQVFQSFVCFFRQTHPAGTFPPFHCLYTHANHAKKNLESRKVTKHMYPTLILKEELNYTPQGSIVHSPSIREASVWQR